MSACTFPTAISRLTDHPHFIHHSGDGFEPQYKLQVAEDGKRSLEIVGRINSYEKIQSFKDSTDINVILQRFASGDTDALQRVQGLYGDFTAMPKTLSELQQRVIDAENFFYQLPLAFSTRTVTWSV